MSRWLRMTLVLLLSASIAGSVVLAAPLSGAHPRRSADTSPISMSLVAQVWRFLSEHWLKNGSHVDPSGNPLPPPSSTTTGDNGSQADPDGVH